MGNTDFRFYYPDGMNEMSIERFLDYYSSLYFWKNKENNVWLCVVAFISVPCADHECSVSLLWEIALWVELIKEPCRSFTVM